jgi:hypothetical protein
MGGLTGDSLTAIICQAIIVPPPLLAGVSTYSSHAQPDCMGGVGTIIVTGTTIVYVVLEIKSLIYRPITVVVEGIALLYTLRR